MALAHVTSFDTGVGALGTTITLSLFPFRPKALMFIYAGHTNASDGVIRTNLRGGVGLATEEPDGVHQCVAAISVPDNTLSGDGNHRHTQADCILVIDNAGGVVGSMKVQAFTDDGVVLEVTDAFPTSQRIHLNAWGSTLARLKRYQFQAGTGNKDFTGIGYEGDAAIFLAPAAGTAPDVHQAAGQISLGAAVSAAAQYVSAFIEPAQGSGTAGSSYEFNGECVIGWPNVSNANPQGRAAFVGFIPDGLTLNQLENDGSYFYALVFKGGLWFLGDLDTRTDAVVIDESGILFEPEGILFASHGKILSTQDVGQPGSTGGATDGPLFGVGFCDHEKDQRAVGWYSQDVAAGANSIVQIGQEHDQVYLPSFSGAAMAVISVDENGFEAQMSVADYQANRVWYLATAGQLVGPQMDVISWIDP